eukprot:gene5312-18557_t
MVDKCLNTVSQQDLAGVEVVDGTRYMSSFQTVHRYGNKTLDIYSVPSYTGMVRKELTDFNTGTSESWQELMSKPVHCDRHVEVNTSLMSMGSVQSFSFAGYESKNGIPARHFVLEISQPGAVDVVVTTDYWDTSDVGNFCLNKNNYPMAFKVEHPFVGLLMIDVVNYTAGLLKPDSMLQLPLPKADFTDTSMCPGVSETEVPLMHSAFDAAWTAPDTAIAYAALQLTRIGGVLDEAAAAYLNLTFGTPSSRHLMSTEDSGGMSRAITGQDLLGTVNVGVCQVTTSFPSWGYDFSAQCSGNIYVIVNINGRLSNKRALLSWDPLSGSTAGVGDGDGVLRF